MAYDVENDIRKIFTGFPKGVVTRLDERDSTEDSLASSYGFLFSEKYFKLVKDWGTVKTSTTGGVVIFNIQSGGSGYSAGDLLTIAGGSGATFRVPNTIAGVVFIGYLETPGTGYTTGSAIATTGGTGTGCTVNIVVVDDNIPTGITAIFGVSILRIEALRDEFIVVFGKKSDELPRFWIRKYRNTNWESFGVGLVSTSGTAVTGGGTDFLTRLVKGDKFIIGSDVRIVTDIASDTSLTVNKAFSTSWGNSSYSYGTTRSTWIELTEQEQVTVTAIDSFTGTGTITATGTAVVGVGTLFTTQLAVGRYIYAGGQVRKIETITDNLNLTVDVAFSPNVSAGSTFKYSTNGFILFYGSLAYTAEGYYSTFIAVNNVYRDFAYIKRSEVTDMRAVSLQTLLTLDESKTAWASGAQAGDNVITVYRFPDTYKLSLLNQVVGDTQYYLGNVSADRLDMGWQRNVPSPEVPMMVDYISRNFFFGLDSEYLKNVEQIYFGREIPDYNAADEAGFSFVPETTSGAGYPIYPDADLRNNGYTRIPTGSNMYDAVDDFVDRADYVTALAQALTGTELELRFAVSGTIPTMGMVRAFFDANVIDTKKADSVFNTNPFTVSLGLIHPNVPTGQVTTSGTTVTGTGGTLFLTQFKPGDRLLLDDTGILECRTVIRIDSNTSLQVDAAYTADPVTPAVNYKRIVTIESGTYFGSGDVVDNVVLVEEQLDAETPTTFSGAAQRFTIRFQTANNVFKEQALRTNVYGVKLDVVSYSATASTLRMIALPMYNDYMLGKPILYSTPIESGGTSGYYPRIKVDFAKLDKRLTDVFIFDDNGDANKTFDEFVSAYRISLVDSDPNKRITPFNLVNRWAHNRYTGLYEAQDVGVGSDSPQALFIGRDTTSLVTLNQWLGYSIVNEIPNIGTNWRYQVKAALGQQALVVIDEDDNVLRFSLYDGQHIHNDHHFANIAQDNSGNPLKAFLISKGELLGILGQLGRIYVFKRASIEVINANTAQSTVLEADVFAKKSILFTALGIVYAGKFEISNFPLHGGLREVISEAIRDKYLSIADDYKENMVAVECKDIGVIIFSIQTSGSLGSVTPSDYTQFCYHVKSGIWWFRRFNDIPKSFTQFADSTVLYASNANPPKLLEYPNRPTTGAPVLSNYLDDGVGVKWAVETQWLDFEASDVQKLLRTFVPVILADGSVPFKVNVYFDRNGAPTDPLASDGTPFDVIYGTSISGIYEEALPFKVPNSFREIKLVFKFADSADLNTTGKFDISEMKLFGEASVTGKEY